MASAIMNWWMHMHGGGTVSVAAPPELPSGTYIVDGSGKYIVDATGTFIVDGP